MLESAVPCLYLVKIKQQLVTAASRIVRSAKSEINQSEHEAKARENMQPAKGAEKHVVEEKCGKACNRWKARENMQQAVSARGITSNL